MTCCTVKHICNWRSYRKIQLWYHTSGSGHSEARKCAVEEGVTPPPKISGVDVPCLQVLSHRAKQEQNIFSATLDTGFECRDWVYNISRSSTRCATKPRLPRSNLEKLCLLLRDFSTLGSAVVEPAKLKNKLTRRGRGKYYPIKSSYK